MKFVDKYKLNKLRAMEEFLKECKEVRNDFVQIAGQYSVGEHLKLRTEIDTLLIMYDQLCERVRVGDTHPDTESKCNKHIVSVSLLERAAGLVGNPGTNISGSTDLACEQWQEDYECWRNER